VNQLVEEIHKIIKDSPSMKQIKYERIPNTVGVVQEVKPGISKTPLALVEFTDPRDGLRKIQLAEIGTIGGFNGQVSEGDLVLISFPMEHCQCPTIVSKYSLPGTNPNIPGSKTTNISKF
jgi:hypothetical protein